MPAPAKARKSSRQLDASAIVRRQVRNRLATEFTAFLEDASEGEKWFLLDVFTSRYSYFMTGEPYVAIASAFEQCILNEDERGEYLCLKSGKLQLAVKQFIQNYKECQAGGKFEAAADGWRLWKGSVA